MTLLRSRVRSRALLLSMLSLVVGACGSDDASDSAGGSSNANVDGPEVQIKPGEVVIVEENTCSKPAAGITVEGDLVVPDTKDIEICARWIMVHGGGRLRIGEEGRPFTHRVTITLVGQNPDEDVMQMGTKFIGAVAGGSIDIHGSPPETAWTKLAGPLAAGVTSFDVLEAKGWRAGDEIVLASGTVEGREAETFRVTAVAGTKLTVDHAIVHARSGLLRTVAGKGVDTRTEVANLTRNVLIRGDEPSTASRLGGHVMIMPGGKGFIDGVELQRMGQFDRIGRYPMHWHLAGDVTGQYVKRSTVNRSFQRGITIHGVQHVLVQDNVVFDTVGHNFIVETPETVDNTWDHNLALVTRLGNFTEATLKTQGDGEPSNWWIRAAKNTFTKNSAAGSVANGFWFDNTTDSGVVFQDNVAHSARGNATDEPDQKEKIDFNRESGIFAHTDRATDGVAKEYELTFERTNLFQNQTDLWPSVGAQRWVDTVFGDSAGTAITGEGCYATFVNPLFAGAAPGKPPALPPLNTQYNGKLIFENPTFVGYAQVLRSTDINQPWMSDYVIKGATLIDTPPSATTPDGFSILETLDDTFRPKGFYTPEGKALVAAGSTQIIPGAPGDPAIFARSNRLAYAGIRTLSGGKVVDTTGVTIKRSDGTSYPGEASAAGFRVIANGGFTYELAALPAGASLALSLDPFENYNQLTTPPGIDPLGIELALPVTKAPTKIERAPQDGGPLAAVASLSAFRASPDGKYFHDVTGKLLYVRLTFAPLTVQP